MPEFGKSWVKERKEPFAQRIKESVRGEEPLRPKMEGAKRAIESQITKLEATGNKLKERDTRIFNRAVGALQRHDMNEASAVTAELAEVRKMSRLVSQSKLVLEQISLRISTAKDLGDLAVNLSPMIPLVKKLRTGLSTVMPQADQEFEQIGSMLSGLVSDVGQIGGFGLSFSASSEEAEKILSEASAVAEKRMKESLPQLSPADVVSEPLETPDPQE